MASEDKWMNEFYANIFICKEALGTVVGIGCKAMPALVDHASHHTLPIHELTGRVPEFKTKFRENVVPPLPYFFMNQIVPMAGARPTRYTRCAVSRTVSERDTNDIMELDPVVTKRGLFKEYSYLHGWKIKTTAKGYIIKTPDNNNTDNQIDICSWGFFVRFWKTTYPKMIIWKAGNDVCSMCYQFNMWHKGNGMFCSGVQGEELDEAEEGDSVVHPIELDYEKDVANDNDEEDAAGYTNRERASLQLIVEANVGAAADDNINDDNVVVVVVVIVVVDDDDSNNNNNNVEQEEKDEAFYRREERVFKRADLLAKLRKHIEEARSMRKLAHKLVRYGKVCTIDNLPPSNMRVAIIVEGGRLSIVQTLP